MEEEIWAVFEEHHIDIDCWYFSPYPEEYIAGLKYMKYYKTYLLNIHREMRFIDIMEYLFGKLSKKEEKISHKSYWIENISKLTSFTKDDK